MAAAGLPYAGDLVNRADLERELRADPRPTLVLSGHIHARCSTHDGPLLQLTVGAVIEPPFDATLVEIDADERPAHGSAPRRDRRHRSGLRRRRGALAVDRDRWELQPAPSAASTSSVSQT